MIGVYESNSDKVLGESKSQDRDSIACSIARSLLSREEVVWATLVLHLQSVCNYASTIL